MQMVLRRYKIKPNSLAKSMDIGNISKQHKNINFERDFNMTMMSPMIGKDTIQRKTLQSPRKRNAKVASSNTHVVFPKLEPQMFKVGVTTSMDQRVDQDIVRLANSSSSGSSEVKVQATEMTLNDKMRG